MRERWWRWLQWTGGLLVLVFVVRFIVRNWAAIRSEPVAWQLGPGWLLASLAIILAAYALLAEAWRRMLAGFGPRLPWAAAARIWVLSSMGKYLPGKVWALAGMAVLAERRGVPAWTAATSAILLQTISLGTGALLVGATGVGALEAQRPGMRFALIGIALASVVGLAVVLRTPFLGRILARLGVEPGHPVKPPGATVAFGVAANLTAWAAYGVVLWCLARGVLPELDLPLADAVAAFAGSYLAGLLFLLAPGGLGVREGVFMWLLQDRIGPANALALAAVSRLGMTVADLLVALPFLLTRARRGAADEPG